MAVVVRPPEPISEYVRHLIDEWEAAGKTLKDLARLAGLGGSMPSQIKGRSSDVTNYSGPKLAHALLGCGYPELVSRAYEWWAAAGGAIPSATPPASGPHRDRAEAIEIARGLGATDDDIARVLRMHGDPEFDGMGSREWLQIFLQYAFPARKLQAIEVVNKTAQRNARQAEARRARRVAEESEISSRLLPAAPLARPEPEKAAPVPVVSIVTAAAGKPIQAAPTKAEVERAQATRKGQKELTERMERNTRAAAAKKRKRKTGGDGGAA